MLTGLWLVTGVLLVVRLWLDSHLELMFDEAYYALWAKHLAWSYFDHPPMVALWIRLSTLLFGEHELGVRALGTLSAAAGTGIIYLISWHLFGNRQAAIFAALLYCAMLLISAGAIIITPDTPLVLFWSIALYALARIYEDGRAGWWWVVGVAMGLALQSKYTAMLLGGGIVCAMAVVPSLRHWWRSPIPYLAGALSLTMFAPVVLWNYQHGWASFAFQFARTNGDGLSLRFLPEFLGGQIGLLTPLVFGLSLGGLWLGLRRSEEEDGQATLVLVSLIGPLLAYFLLHSLHARVNGNWIAPAYPVFAVLGAQAAFQQRQFPARAQTAIAFSRRWAVPVGLAFVGIAYVQAAAAPIPFNPSRDPTALMAGWSDLAAQVDATADKIGAQFLLTSHYRLTSELSVYSRAARPIIQFNERLRWLSLAGSPPPPLERGVYVVEAARDESREISARFRVLEKVAEIRRTRNGRPIATYVLYLVAEPRTAPLDDFTLIRSAQNASR